MTLTYNPNLAKVKVDPHTKNQGQRSNGSAVRALTSKQTDRRNQVHYLPASRAIIKRRQTINLVRENTCIGKCPLITDTITFCRIRPAKPLLNSTRRKIMGESLT